VVTYVTAVGDVSGDDQDYDVGSGGNMMQKGSMRGVTMVRGLCTVVLVVVVTRWMNNDVVASLFVVIDI
jgi:type IV secretory pathway TrbD component